MVVGGVASNFFRDLDGDAICPDAIQRAIPGFMATRGPDGLKGGPIRLHHGFWERFLKQSISALNIPYDQQVGLLAAIALPLGRVTEMSVDSDGTTRWRGVLSGANPIARVVWNMLKEGMVHLGVSVGGKINGVRPGRDVIGRTCNLITDVRLDELSITDNPANRLIESETPDNGAYITALAKSVGNTMLAQKQQHYIYLNGIAYTAHPSEEHGIVLRKAGRRRQPSPGQLGLFGGHNEGDTKVEDGVTYRLNSNSRWERMDKPKASGKPSGGKKKAEKPAIVPVVEAEKEEDRPKVAKWLEEHAGYQALLEAKESGAPIDTEASIGKATVKRINPPNKKYPYGSVSVQSVEPDDRLGAKETFDIVLIADRVKRANQGEGPFWRQNWRNPAPNAEPAAQDPEPTVSEMLEQQQAAIADEPMPEDEAMEGAEDGAIAPMLSREAIANMSESAYVDYEINAIQQKAQASIKQAQNAIKQYLSRTSQKPPVGIAPENMLLAKNNPSKEERRLIADYKIAKSKLLSKEQIESEKETFRHVHQRITGRKQSSDLEDLGFVIKSLTPSLPMTIDNFLRKALGNPGREFGSGSWRDTGIPAMGRTVTAKSPQPKGGKKVQMDESGSAHAGKGIGGKQPKAHRPYSSGGMPPTDVFGITITQLTRNLAKACYMDKDAWGSPETVSFLTDSARAIAGMTDSPTDPMVNFVRFLQYCTRFAQELPFMNDYQAAGTVKAMNADLTKALDEFVEKMPEELKGKPLRPAGSPGVVGIDVQFPQQYVIYS
jgi:hypothetical protein